VFAAVVSLRAPAWRGTAADSHPRGLTSGFIARHGGARRVPSRIGGAFVTVRRHPVQPSSCGAIQPITNVVDALVLVLMLGASMLLAVLGARTMLGGVLHLMANPPAPARVLRGGVAVGVMAAGVGLWYLAPVIASQLP
jgi:hypothetical protein